jgi:hypothetical protein
MDNQNSLTTQTVKTSAPDRGDRREAPVGAVVEASAKRPAGSPRATAREARRALKRRAAQPPDAAQSAGKRAAPAKKT